MANESDAVKAIEALNGYELSGRKMIVTQAKPRENAGVENQTFDQS